MLPTKSFLDLDLMGILTSEIELRVMVQAHIGKNQDQSLLSWERKVKGKYIVKNGGNPVLQTYIKYYISSSTYTQEKKTKIYQDKFHSQ